MTTNVIIFALVSIHFMVFSNSFEIPTKDTREKPNIIFIVADDLVKYFKNIFTIYDLIKFTFY